MHLHKYDKSLWIYMSKFSELSLKIVSVVSSLRLLFREKGLVYVIPVLSSFSFVITLLGGERELIVLWCPDP